MALNVSQAYREAMLRPVLESRISIVMTDGTSTMTLTDRDILRDSLSINWRATNNQTFSLGTCYAASLTFTSFKRMETVIEGRILTITPTLYFKLKNGNEEAIPLGVFYCDQPTVFARTTTYECYDGMIRLDHDIGTRVSGTPFNMLTYIAERCGIGFGTTPLQIAQMANPIQPLFLDPAQVKTFRDALSYICIILGAYAQFGRDGRLYVRKFHIVPDMTLSRKRRTSASFAGYQTMFKGVKCRFLAEQNFYPYEYYGSRIEGVTLDLGDIPIVEDTIENKNTILQNIYRVVEDIVYSPCEINMVGDPSIEAGDMISTQNREGYSKNILLTSVTYNWRRESTILSEGANPKSSQVTTAAKKTNRKIENSSANNTVVTATYVNADQITVGSAVEKEITSLRFTTNKDLTAIFGAEIPCCSTGDGYITITYENNGVNGDEVIAQVHEGYNLVTLVNHLHYDVGQVVFLKLKAQTSAIGSGTAPSITISQDKIRSYIFAQGIEVEAPWDGIIVIAEYVPYVQTIMALYGITDNAIVEVKNPVESTLSEIVAAVSCGSQTISISDTMTLTLKYGDWVLKMGMGHRAGMGRMLAPYQVT